MKKEATPGCRRMVLVKQKLQEEEEEKDERMIVVKQQDGMIEKLNPLLPPSAAAAASGAGPGGIEPPQEAAVQKPKRRRPGRPRKRPLAPGEVSGSTASSAGPPKKRRLGPPPSLVLTNNHHLQRNYLGKNASSVGTIPTKLEQQENGLGVILNPSSGELAGKPPPPPAPPGDIRLQILPLPRHHSMDASAAAVAENPLLSEATRLLFATFPGLYPPETFPDPRQGPLPMPPKVVRRVNRTGLRRSQPIVHTLFHSAPLHSYLAVLYRDPNLASSSSVTGPQKNASGGSGRGVNGKTPRDSATPAVGKSRAAGSEETAVRAAKDDGELPEAICVAFFDLVEVITRRSEELPQEDDEEEGAAAVGVKGRKRRERSDGLVVKSKPKSTQLPTTTASMRRTQLGQQKKSAEHCKNNITATEDEDTAEEAEEALREALAASEAFFRTGEEVERTHFLRLLLLGTDPKFRGFGAGRLVVNLLRDFRYFLDIEMAVCCSPVAFHFWHQTLVGRFTRAPALDETTEALNAFTDTRLLRQAPKTSRFLDRQTISHSKLLFPASSSEQQNPNEADGGEDDGDVAVAMKLETTIGGEEKTVISELSRTLPERAAAASASNPVCRRRSPRLSAAQQQQQQQGKHDEDNRKDGTGDVPKFSFTGLNLRRSSRRTRNPLFAGKRGFDAGKQESLLSPTSFGASISDDGFSPAPTPPTSPPTSLATMKRKLSSSGSEDQPLNNRSSRISRAKMSKKSTPSAKKPRLSSKRSVLPLEYQDGTDPLAAFGQDLDFRNLSPKNLFSALALYCMNWGKLQNPGEQQTTRVKNESNQQKKKKGKAGHPPASTNGSGCTASASSDASCSTEFELSEAKSKKSQRLKQ